jgi:hypothetical protein
MKSFASLLCFAMAGCAATPAPQTVSVAFNPAEVAWFNAPGRNTIKGSAVMRTVGGDVRTCAGADANLVPDSTYARARMQTMFGGLERGLLSARSGFTWSGTDPRYQAASRTTTCDPQGFFTFEAVPDGTYYVTAKVVWGVPTQYFTSWQGGYVMQRVEVRGGETRQVVLTA